MSVNGPRVRSTDCAWPVSALPGVGRGRLVARGMGPDEHRTCLILRLSTPEPSGHASEDGLDHRWCPGPASRPSSWRATCIQTSAPEMGRPRLSRTWMVTVSAGLAASWTAAVQVARDGKASGPIGEARPPRPAACRIRLQNRVFRDTLSQSKRG